MKATAKDLRFHSRELLDTVSRGEEVVITYRGRPCAKLVPYEEENKSELNCLRKSLRGWNTKLLYISEEISSKAMFYVEQYYLSHSLQLADALIGATAVVYSLPILTSNDKHYKMIKDIQIKKFRP